MKFKILTKLQFVVLFVGIGLFAWSCAGDKYNTDKEKVVVQNDTNNILDGETIYPEQVKAVINHYNSKYGINIKYVEGEDGLEEFVKNVIPTKKPQAVFQYNKGHKYGFIFLKYNQTDYCVIVDTIPHLSHYIDDLSFDGSKMFIDFGNGKKYRAIMFGENLQKAGKGCGSFTLAIFKQLLKLNALPLYEVIRLDAKYGNGDKTKRDKTKKSILRGTDFSVVKGTYFAPYIYKYAQSMSLQQEFDNVFFKNKNINFKTYRNFYSTQYKDKQVSTKVFEITQKYKDMANENNTHMNEFKDKLFAIPSEDAEQISVKGLQTYKKYFNPDSYTQNDGVATKIVNNIVIEESSVGEQ